MEERSGKSKELFEELLFGPIEKFFGPLVDDEVKKHLSQARIELLKAMRVAIDREIEKAEKKQQCQ
ncbi:MAG: hypothetical protein PWP60_1222 [Candidatus Atribacteria bacterium]|jgi:hypothetical protein|uniref:Uncharacterized protein n=1 Tax=Thermatribacter velox TaxID=3039681 RepID=A0ABZ2YGL9_9BACT|nr:hypothetical protein [Candidatus Atribacteria bacterium]MDI3531373.1 hypothetical protein [Candidatus Atribacteria bacterium]